MTHLLLLLLLSHFSHVQLCVTPQTAAHQAPPSLGFSRQEHWSGVPLPSPSICVLCLYFCISRRWVIEDIALIYAIKCSAYVFLLFYSFWSYIRSLIHFEFIFVYGIRKFSNFILLHVAVQFSQHHLLKRLSLPHCIFLPPLSKIRYP